MEITKQPADSVPITNELNFIIKMRDQFGDFMEKVGFAADPWEISVLMQNVEADGEYSMSGATTTIFDPESGNAFFENIFVSENVKKAKFVFFVSKPTEKSVKDISTNVIEFTAKPEEPEPELPTEGKTNIPMYVIILFCIIAYIVYNILSTNAYKVYKYFDKSVNYINILYEKLKTKRYCLKS